MANLTRHIGRYTNSGSRVVVVFRKLEDEPEYCLIVESDSLPDMVQDSLMQIVNGVIGQKEVDLYKTLTRSNLSDGSNALTALHTRGMMKKVKVNMIEMVPYHNRPVPLADINAAIDGTAVEGVSNVIADAAPVVLDTGDTDKNAEIAAGLIAQAELMEGDAKAKREQAAALLPKAKAKKKVSDGRGKSDAEKAATLEARNERRRLAYEANKQSAIDAKIDAQIAEKVIRDAKLAEVN